MEAAVAAVEAETGGGDVIASNEKQVSLKMMRRERERVLVREKEA